MSVFYDPLINLKEINSQLLALNLPTKQHYHLLKLADSTLHHDVLNSILINLPPTHHEYFLVELHSAPNSSSHLDYLKQFSSDIEDIIKLTALRTKARLLREIRELT
jgi:hypothetical protein